MTRKFGTASQWFSYASALFFPGLGIFSGSFAPFVGEFEYAVRVVGIGASFLGVCVAIAGVAVWRHNLHEDVDASVVIVGEASGGDARRAALAQKRDDLEVEKAGLQPAIRNGLTVAAVGVSYGSKSPAQLAREVEHVRAVTRDRQISHAIRAIDAELTQLIKESE